MFHIFLLGVLLMVPALANQLIHEDSPYLQQHAHNPVAWYPWGEEAFLKAKKEDKLIFLSIGYSTCHWCHVMEHESFENKSVAEILNKDFVSIKVDREEYPHIDRHYQDIYALMNKRGGGWPLTIVMTPTKRVFFSATYMPAEDQYGRAGLKGMLKLLNDAYHDRRAEVEKSATSIEKAMKAHQDKPLQKREIKEKKIASLFVREVKQSFDYTNKGIGNAPKFPHATTLGTLLDLYSVTGDKDAKNLALESLLAMSKGGIYDQIEGGFYRYSTDARWMIPHFEKMLYTNGELLSVYAKAYALTHNQRFKEVVEESIENIHTYFYTQGLYYSASDADSDGKEGKYFVFDYHDSLKELEKGGFSKEDAKSILTYFSIYEEGNFEDEQTNPYLSGLKRPSFLEKGRALLVKNRAKKHYPFIDTKIQTSWNALYIRGLFKAGKWVDKRHQKEALYSLDQLLKHLYINKVLYHQVILGKKAKIKGYLEDYSFLIAALLEGYQASFEEKYLTLARVLLDEAMEKFYHQDQWYMSDDAFRSKAALYDASYASAKAIMIENIFAISLLQEDLRLDGLAKKMLSQTVRELAVNPSQYPTAMLLSLQSLKGGIVLKSTIKNLENSREEIAQIRYPFIFLKPGNHEEFLACKIDQCFASDVKLKNVIQKIDNL